MSYTKNNRIVSRKLSCYTSLSPPPPKKRNEGLYISLWYTVLRKNCHKKKNKIVYIDYYGRIINNFIELYKTAFGMHRRAYGRHQYTSYSIIGHEMDESKKVF